MPLILDQAMNILLIENVWMGKRKLKFFEKLLLTFFSILPTLHARQIAAMTPKNHTIHVLNERYESIDFKKSYDLVHINFTTSTAPRAYEIADKFKAKKITVTLSGAHASSLPYEALQHGDAVLLGRGELNWPTLLKDFQQNRLKKIYPSPPYDTNCNLPATAIKLPGFIITAAIEATRGCPYRCEFCPESQNNTKPLYYKRPIDDVIKEIKSIPQKTLQFYDSSLTIDPDYTKQLFRQMKGLGKKFFCNGNVDILACDDELLKCAKEAGCIAWLIGFESISQDTIDSIGKITNTTQYYEKAIKKIHSNKMAVIGCFIFGFDSETPAVFEQTLYAIQKMNVDICDFCVLTPLPGTALYKRLESESRLLTKNWEKYNLKTVVFQPKQMTPDQLQRGIQKMYRHFYSPFSIITRILGSIHLGFFAFFVVTVRTIIALMNSKR
ncbi:MAG: radical SAM protein [Thermoplasmatota archaeon]